MECNTFRYDYTGGATFNFYLASDTHFAHKLFDEDMFRREFNKAVESDATIDINGDVVDLIMPKDIRRYSASGDTISCKGSTRGPTLPKKCCSFINGCSARSPLRHVSLRRDVGGDQYHGGFL